MLSCRMFREIRGISSNWSQVKRYAGHSKWHNIRHTKAGKDMERSVLYARKLRDIRIALAGSGWNTDPSKSPALARAIDGALTANVPKETVESYLQKLQKMKETPIEFRLRGPNDCIIVITYSCTNFTENELRSQVRKLLAKSSIVSATTGFSQAFEKKGVIVAKYLSEDCTMDDAEEAAIIGGAEEVRPEEDKHVFRFLTEPESVWSVTKYLRSNNWEIHEANVEELPAHLVEVPKADLDELMKEISKFQEFPEFLKIYDNIA